jgi:hypothetical protein
VQNRKEYIIVNALLVAHVFDPVHIDDIETIINNPKAAYECYQEALSDPHYVSKNYPLRLKQWVIKNGALMTLLRRVKLIGISFIKAEDVRCN